MTPQQWLNKLATRLDYRAGRVALLRSYMDGHAPLPEGAEGCRDAYAKFQRKARTNFGELVVEAVAERMVVSGFRAGVSQDDDDEARRVWKRSRMGAGSSDVHRDMLGMSVGYVMASGNPGAAVLTWERPEQVVIEPDPLRPGVAQAGLKVFRSTATDYAFVHIPGLVSVFTRPSFDLDHGQKTSRLHARDRWEPAGEAETGLSFVPIWEFENRKGLGEFETHTDVLDRINWGILQRLVITAMQAYRQRAVKGELPSEDANGKEIDYAEVFRPGPGSLWELPDGVELWESQLADLTPILSAVKDDVTHLAAVTRTPMATLIPDSANQSAEGAAFAKEGLIFKAQDRIERAAWDVAMGGALAIERGQRDLVEDVATVWLPPERQSLAERADAASKAQDFPWRERMEKIWQQPAAEVDRMESQRAQDMLQAAALIPVPSPGPGVTDVQAG